MSERRIFVAASGRAQVYRQRANVLSRLAAGAHEARMSDAFVVTSTLLACEGDDFLGTSPGLVVGEAMVRSLAAQG